MAPGYTRSSTRASERGRGLGFHAKNNRKTSERQWAGKGSLAALALSAGAGLAHADDATTVYGTSPRVEHVRYQTSELASEAGIRSLRSRVRSASHRVCAPGERTYTANYSEFRCFSPTVRHAMAQVDRAIAQTRTAAGSAGAASIAVTVR